MGREGGGQSWGLVCWGVFSGWGRPRRSVIQPSLHGWQRRRALPTAPPPPPPPLHGCPAAPSPPRTCAGGAPARRSAERRGERGSERSRRGPSAPARAPQQPAGGRPRSPAPQGGPASRGSGNTASRQVSDKRDTWEQTKPWRATRNVARLQVHKRSRERQNQGKSSCSAYGMVLPMNKIFRVPV